MEQLLSQQQRNNDAEVASIINKYKEHKARQEKDVIRLGSISQCGTRNGRVLPKMANFTNRTQFSKAPFGLIDIKTVVGTDKLSLRAGKYTAIGKRTKSQQTHIEEGKQMEPQMLDSFDTHI